MAGRPGGFPVNGSNTRLQDAPANTQPEPEELSPEEIDATRTREITAKAMTGVLLLLLKWLRLSRK
jgi:hypothetical protein